MKRAQNRKMPVGMFDFHIMATRAGGNEDIGCWNRFTLMTGKLRQFGGDMPHACINFQVDQIRFHFLDDATFMVAAGAIP